MGRDQRITPVQKIEKALLNQISVSDDPSQLRDLSKVYGEEATRRRITGQRHRNYELIKDVADYKARVRSLAVQRAQETKKRNGIAGAKAFLLSSRFLNAEDYAYGAARWAFMKGKSSLAFKKQAYVMCYIVSP